MFIKKMMLATLFMSFIFSTIACQSEPPPEERFQLTIEDPQTVVQAGDTVTYTARLTNRVNKTYTLSHGDPLISLYIRAIGDDIPQVIYPVLVETQIGPNGTIDKTLKVEALESGEYILRAFSSFSVGDEEYQLECGEVSITVE